jgi:hypothetical protein|tara:strand:- start:3983 stop:4423 length:441 start_codon:yes stop_codon:yes gene_type:complete
MSRGVKTARGKIIDMASMAMKHEQTRAVSNVLMNARGDRLNPDGSVKVKVEDIALAHQNLRQPPQEQPISNTKPITPKAKAPEPEIVEPEEFAEPEMPDLDVEFEEEIPSEPVSRITRTREDGTRFLEIEYEDGSIETLEVSLDEE